MSYENSWIITCGLCCIWPLAFHLGALWISRRAKLIDWENVRLPWRKQ